MENLIRTTRELIGIESVKSKPTEKGPFGDGVAQALEYTLKKCEELGFSTKDCGGYVGYAEIGQGEEMVGILVHLDVVPAGDGWNHEPFFAEVDGGRIYGRGAIDDKGPAVACIYALKDILDSGIELKRRIRIIFGLDEETDWEDMDYYTEHEEHPALGFTPDGDFPVIYGEKGIVSFDIVYHCENGLAGEWIGGGAATNAVADQCQVAVKVEGAGLEFCQFTGIPAHSSTPERGENAIGKMMEQLWQMRVDGKISKDSVIGDFAKFFNETLGYDCWGKTLGIFMEDEESGPLTFNLGKIVGKGGEIRLSVDIRYPVTAKYEEMMESIVERVVETNQIKRVTIENISHMEPVYIPKDSRLIETLRVVYQDYTGDPSPAVSIGGGTYARAMKNIVAFGPRFPGQAEMAHCRDEYIELADLKLIRKIYFQAMKQLATASS